MIIIYQCVDDKLFIPNFYDTNGCITSTSLELKKVTGGFNLQADAGNNVIQQKKLKCFPNPFTNQVKVVLDVEEATPGTLVIQDPFGKILLKQESNFHIGRNIITLDDFKDYPNGLFMLSIQTDEQIYSVKMLKN